MSGIPHNHWDGINHPYGMLEKHYNENGIWIKDEINDEIFIINGSTKKNNYLENVFITKFNKNFDIIENIFSAKVDISSNNWILEKPTLFKNNKQMLEIYR